MYIPVHMTGNEGSMVKGQSEEVCVFDSRASLHTLALFCLGHNWGTTVKAHFPN